MRKKYLFFENKRLMSEENVRSACQPRLKTPGIISNTPLLFSLEY